MDVRSTLLPIVLLASSTSVLAEEKVSNTSVETPFYASIEASMSKFGDLGAGVTDVTGVDDSSKGYSVAAGYQVNQWLAVEVGYVDLGKADLKDVAGSYSATAIEFTAIGSYPVYDKTHLYAKLGTANYDWDASGPDVYNDDKDWTSTVGFGVSYQFHTQFGAKVEYQNYTNVGGPNIAQTSLGLTYKF